MSRKTSSLRSALWDEVNRRPAPPNPYQPRPGCLLTNQQVRPTSSPRPYLVPTSSRTRVRHLPRPRPPSLEGDEVDEVGRCHPDGTVHKALEAPL